MATREIEKTDIIVTMKDKTYTAVACGFDFKEGVATATMNIEKGSVDRVKLDNVLALNAGTSWRKKGDPDPEVAAKKAKKAEDEKAEAAKKEEAKATKKQKAAPAKVEATAPAKTEAEKQAEHKAAVAKKKAAESK